MTGSAAWTLAGAVMVFLGLVFQVGFDWKKEPELKARHIGIALIGLVGLLVAAGSAWKQSRESGTSEKELKTCNTTIADANTKITQLSEAVKTGEEDARVSADAQRKQLVELGERLGTIKGEATSARERAQIESLEKQLEIANAPRPLAQLQVGFVDPTPGTRIGDRESTTFAPIKNGRVKVALVVYNDSVVAALNAQLVVRICTGCAYVSEPRNSTKAFGGVETDRNFIFPRIVPNTVSERVVIEFSLPVGVSADRLTVGTKAFCDNCPPPSLGVDQLLVTLGT